MSNERREDEKRRREAAQASIVEVEPGGHEVAGRSIKQMVSVRLEAQLLKELRELAEKQEMSVSDLLRQAAVELVERSRTAPVLVHYRRSEASLTIATALTAGRQVTSGLFTTVEDPQAQVSGNELASVLTG
jgi:uncharacterized protein (DUF4415 family)